LGARGVGVGRAALFGLGAGGKEGVERVLESMYLPLRLWRWHDANQNAVLKAETETCMRLLGVEKVEQLGMQYINTRAVERDIYDGPILERSSVKARL
jgi:L-lactate dehydrogenase (cytochrome)